jgi:hypothetical protein
MSKLQNRWNANMPKSMQYFVVSFVLNVRDDHIRNELP